MYEEQKGLIYTNDNCIGCNKCIAACPVITANRAIDNGDKQMIIVDGDRCIACGACFDAVNIMHGNIVMIQNCFLRL